MFTLQDAVNALQQHCCQPKTSGAGYTAHCPVHEADGSHNPSLSIAPGDKQPVVMTCHAGCAYADITKALGLDTTRPPQSDQRRIKATYSYQDASGNEVSQKVRYEPKDFRQRWPDGNGGWLRKKPKDAPAVLYCLPEVLEAKAQSATVFFVEGEKDANQLRDLGLVATCNIEGASKEGQKPKWNPAYTEQLTGCAQLVIIPDNDEAGRAHARHVAQQLQGKVADLRYLELPDLPEKGDVFDWFNQGGKLAAFLDLVEKVPNGAKPKDDKKSSAQEDHGPARPATIRILAGGLPEATDQAEAALIQHGAGIYQRGDYLCRISYRPPATVRGITWPQGAVTLTPIDRDATLDRLNRLIHWQKWNEKQHDFKRCNAPAAIAMTLLSRSGHWNFPPLIGVVSAPTLRPDGSVLDKPGYDKTTGLFLDIREGSFPPLPPKPSRDEGQAALQFLKNELLDRPCLNSKRPEDQGFSFVADRDRSKALAAILSGLIRLSLPTAPLFAVSATRRGSAKTLLANIPALIATGRKATNLDLGNNPEETEKRIVALLITGTPMTLLDNLVTPLTGAHLCRLLTEEEYTGRYLGATRMVTNPTATLITATGNNLRIFDDVIRRVVKCNLDPRSEFPENRQYDRDLATWIPENRPALVKAGLTALRAFVVAGQPQQTPSLMGSFQDWDRNIRQALIWLGETDPLEDMEEMEGDDPEGKKLRALLHAWFTTFGEQKGFTSREVMASANETKTDDEGQEKRTAQALWDVLTEHFTDRRGTVRSQLIGEFIAKHIGRVEMGARFEKWHSSSHNCQIWQIVIVDNDRFQKFLTDSNQGNKGNKGNRQDGQYSGDPDYPCYPDYLHKNIFGVNAEVFE